MRRAKADFLVLIDFSLSDSSSLESSRFFYKVEMKFSN